MTDNRVNWEPEVSRHDPDVVFETDVVFDTDTILGSKQVVSVWAGGVVGVAYLSPANARRAADEWPAILRNLADKAEQER